MAKKSKPSSKTSSPGNKQLSSGAPGTILQLGKSLLYAIAGAFLFYFFNHVLVFSPRPTSGYVLVFSSLCGVLAFVCSTRYFQKLIDPITYIGLGLIMIQVLVTVALTYTWIKASIPWMYISGTIAIPLGILWYFILKNKATPDPVNKDMVYSVKPIFQDHYVKILSLLVFVVCGALIFYRLGFYDVWEDENSVINAAIGIQQQGLAYLKDGYDRVWMHSLLISWVFDMFGVSEFNGRLPSAVFGLIFVLACYYVYSRWYGIGLVAIMVPVVCLMNDRFLILFRYMRMYALLIPIFLIAVYFIYRTITIKNKSVLFRGKAIPLVNTKILYIAGSVIMLLLLAHLHKLSMIILPAFFILISILAWSMKSKELKYFLFLSIGGGLLLAILSFGLELHALRMFRQVTDAIMKPHGVYGEYYWYLLENGLPVNSTLMTMIGGLGLLRSRISFGTKSIMGLSYLLVGMAGFFMIYLIASEGQDYRYTAHLVPFVVGILLFVWYKSGQLISGKIASLSLFFILVVSSLNLKDDYRRVYVKHPWAPSYSIAYKTIKDKYKPGDAIFTYNMKSYYLDPEKLAGNLYHKVPGKKQYSLEEFKRDITLAQKGWIVWDKHKIYHWREEVIRYIYENFKPYHGGPIDDIGVEVWYFNETMIK